MQEQGRDPKCILSQVCLVLDHYQNHLLNRDCASLLRMVTRSRLNAPCPLDCITQVEL